MGLCFKNQTRGTTLATDARVADSFASRLRGLLYSKPIVAGQGLLLKPCNSIHMIGMTYPIDAIFLDDDYKVVGLVDDIQPMQVSKVYKEARACLELPSGTISSTGTQLGDQLVNAIELK
ncbi:MAG: DUF192 domain-containing protein [Candidatus Obscuribacterales bacterium]|nr:DUF192 domain-containing protein [Cyanobacteria bacterium SZAS LIN-5]RTL45390.1 MAG: DUF192 domain-containing protein [Candidatus Melainabacteria bacterium]